MGKKAKKEKKVKWWMVALVLIFLGIILPSGKDDDEVSKEMPTPTAEATFTPAPTSTPIPTEKPTETPTPVPTATNTPTPVPVLTNTPTPSPTPQIIGNTQSNKYHTRNCGFLPDEENRAYFDSVEEAKAAGMTLCGHCNRY